MDKTVRDRIMLNQHELALQYIEEDYIKYSQDEDLVDIVEYVESIDTMEVLQQPEIRNKVHELLSVILPKRIVDKLLELMLSYSNNDNVSEIMKGFYSGLSSYETKLVMDHSMGLFVLIYKNSSIGEKIPPECFDQYYTIRKLLNDSDTQCALF